MCGWLSAAMARASWRKRVGVTAVERLDGHRPAQAGVDGLVDLAHATRAQHGHDFIRTETGTGSQRH